jgi:hypothetical protein
MNIDSLFEATPRWEKAIEEGLMRSGHVGSVTMFLLLDCLAIAGALAHYSVTTAVVTVIFSFLLFLLFGSSYIILRLCDEARLRIACKPMDSDSRRAFLNISYMGFRLYLILIATPGILFLAMQAVRS